MNKKLILLGFLFLAVIHSYGTLSSPTLSSPTNGVNNISPNCTFSWSNISTATYYEIRTSESASFTNASIATSSSATFTNTSLNFGTLYYWQVRAKSATDSSNWSTAFSLTTTNTVILSSPVAGASINAAAVDIAWAGVANIGAYDINYDTTITFASNAAIYQSISSTANYIGIPDLYFGKKYYWRVRARNAVDTSGWSNTWNFRISNAPIALIIPTNNSTDKGVSLSVSYITIPGITEYKIEIDSSLNFNSNLHQLYSSYVAYAGLSGLHYNTKYYWRVKGLHANDSLDWSPPWSFFTSSTVTLKDPVSGVVNVDFQLSLTYYTLNGSNLYQYEIDSSSGFASALKKTKSVTLGNITTDSLHFGTKYFWRMRAMSSTDTSLWCNPWTFTTAKMALSLPANNATGILPALSLEYFSISGSSGYDFELDTSLSFSSAAYRSYSRSTSGYQAVANLLYGKKYYWRARARNSVDTSQWTAPWNFTVIDKPTLISPADKTVNSALTVQLKWNTSGGSSGYEVQYSEDINFKNYADTITTLGQYNLYGLKYGGIYFWRIRMFHSGDTSQWSDVWTFTTIYQLGSTTLISPVNYASNIPLLNLSLQYSAVTNATSYEVQWDINLLFNTAKSGSSTTTSFMIDTLVDGESYKWRVRAKNANGYGPWSLHYFNTVVISLNTPTLDYPRNDSANVPINNLSLWCSAITNALKYNFQYDTDSNFTNPVSYMANVPHLVLNGLPFSTKYYWRVRAIHDSVYSNWSARWKFTTSASVLSTPVLNLPSNGALNIAVMNTQLSWNSVFNAVKYEVQFDTSSGLLNPTTLIKLYPYHVMPLLLSNTNYYWRVRAMDNNLNYSNWSQAWNFTTETPALSPPPLYTPTNGSTNIPVNVSLVWGSILNASSYELELDTSAGFIKGMDTILTTTSFGLSNLNKIKTYYWRVRAKNNNTYSTWSAIYSFSTVTPFLPSPNLLSPNDGNINVPVNGVKLIWSNVTDANRYEIQYDTLPSFSLAFDTITSLLSHGLPNLKYSKTYYWRVRAKNDSLTSLWTNASIFTTITEPIGVASLVAPADNSSGLSLTVNLKWASVWNASIYECQYSQFNNFIGNVYSGNATSTNVNTGLLNPRTKYYWRVRAYNDSTTANWSVVWSFTTSDVGLNSLNQNLNLSLFPNPCRNTLNILVENPEINDIHIFDAEGKEIGTGKISIVSQGVINIEMTDVEAGLYFLIYKNKAYRFNKEQ
jgi:hypothetical protein